MANRIEIGFRKKISDALGEKIKRRIVEHLQMNVAREHDRCVHDRGQSHEDGASKSRPGPLSDPVIQKHAVNRGLAAGFRLADRGGLPPRRDGQRRQDGRGGHRASRRSESRCGSTRRGSTSSTGPNQPRPMRERIASGCSPTISSSATRSSTAGPGTRRRASVPTFPKVAGVDDPRVEEIDLDVPDDALAGSAAAGRSPSRWRR